MKVMNNQELNSVSGAGVPAVIIYVLARKAIVAGVKHYAKKSATAAGTGAIGGGTTAVLTDD